MADLLDDLIARIEGLRGLLSGRVLIGIAGAPGSGKTTLAESLVSRLAGPAPDALPPGVPAWADSRVAHVPMDGFHLADVELTRLGRMDRKGAPDTFDPAGYAALLRRILDGERVWAPGFERVLEQPIAQSLPVTTQTQIVISEGNYLLLPDPAWEPLRDLFSEIWFCRMDDSVRLERLIARHVRFGRSPSDAREWVLRSDESNAAIVAATQASADLVIDVSSLLAT
jgi:pantothenate kinase